MSTVFFALIGPIVASLYYIRKDFFIAWDTSKIVLLGLAVSVPLAALNALWIYFFIPQITERAENSKNARAEAEEKFIVVTASVTGFVLYFTNIGVFLAWEFFKIPSSFAGYVITVGIVQILGMVVVAIFGKDLLKKLLEFRAARR